MNRSTLVIDVEGVRNPDFPGKVKEMEEGDDTPDIAAPINTRIIVIGAMMLDERMLYRKLRFFVETRESLAEFVSILDNPKLRVITFNGRRYDMPVITHAMFRHGIPCRRYFASSRNDDFRYRYSINGPHLDLLDHLSDFGNGRRAGLDQYAKAIGLPGKDGTSGDDVQGMWERGEVDAIRTYNAQDVLCTAAVALRDHWMVGGFGTRAEFEAAARRLIEGVSHDHPALVPYCERVDMSRLLDVYDPSTTPEPTSAEPEAVPPFMGA
jgi:predicted PolB exonuclease-like 3'-5' exonuclease